MVLTGPAQPRGFVYCAPRLTSISSLIREPGIASILIGLAVAVRLKVVVTYFCSKAHLGGLSFLPSGSLSLILGLNQGKRVAFTSSMACNSVRPELSARYTERHRASQWSSTAFSTSNANRRWFHDRPSSLHAGAESSIAAISSRSCVIEVRKRICCIGCGKFKRSKRSMISVLAAGRIPGTILRIQDQRHQCRPRSWCCFRA